MVATMREEENKDEAASVEKAREGLKELLKHKFKDKFCSTPIDLDASNNRAKNNEEAARPNSPHDKSMLTISERDYLEKIVNSGNPADIQAASLRLSDPTLFPELSESDSTLEEQPPGQAPVQRRSCEVQQQLFKLHENSTVQPSEVLQRMSFMHRNSLLESSEDVNDNDYHQPSFHATSSGSWDMEAEGQEADNHQQHHRSYDDEHHLNRFKDISSWLDGSEGVEVNDSGEPLPKEDRPQRPSKASFLILGTAADDVSCHPHVLSPPLMESLLNFVPESLQDYHFWLKYSLVRDGANLWTMLRQVRASSNCILAIETVDGHVFGAYTSQSWRLAQGWYGSQESFLFKMRHSRLKTTQSIVEQACQEGEIQVYPHRQGNVAVQYCSKECLMLGQGELLPTTKAGKHYGYGMHLEANLSRGTTSNCETFGNPCLVDDNNRGSRFEVSNLEVWTLTPHKTVEEAEQSELSAMFLEGGRDAKNHLNVMGILVGGAI